MSKICQLKSYNHRFNRLPTTLQNMYTRHDWIYRLCEWIGAGGRWREPGRVCVLWMTLSVGWQQLGSWPLSLSGARRSKNAFSDDAKVDGAIFLEHCVQRCSKELKNWPPSDKSSDEPGPSETNVLEVSLLGDTQTFSHLRNWWFEGKKKKKYPVSTTLRSYKRITKIIPNIST